MNGLSFFSVLRSVVTKERPVSRKYAIALVLFAAALGVTLFLRPWILPSPFPFFFAATMVVGCVGGVGPGLVSTVLSSASVLHFFLPPLLEESGSLSVSTVIRFGSFLTVSLIIAGLSSALRSSLRASEASVEALRFAEEERAALFAREHQWRAEAEAARERFSFLAEASALLDASLDYPTTLASVACLAVPHLGDWCIIDMIEQEAGGKTGVYRLAVAHADPAQRLATQKLKLKYPPRPDDQEGATAVAKTGKSELKAEVSKEWLKTFARDGEHWELLQKLGFASYMCVPISARGRNLGAITLVRGEGHTPYAAADLALAKDLAHRAALAIDTARLVHLARMATGAE